MKGIIFTEFLDMVEDRFGLAATDRIIDAAASATGGAYTAVGTYDHQEMVRMVAALSQEIGIPAADLARVYGQHLFGYFVRNHAEMFAGLNSTFDFLAHVDGYIHVEVRKLYANAELPRFEISAPTTATTMTMTYRSVRALADVAEGLMNGCAAHFGEQIEVRRSDLSGGQGTVVEFILEKVS
jgi:hypothetical protein